MDARRELLCCMFTFDVPKTQHVCYETVFGRDLAPHTIQQLQYLSMSNSQMKVVLDSNAHCRYIRPVVKDYLQRLSALEASLKKAHKDGYLVRIANLPHFEWTSAVEQKDCCDHDRVHTDPTTAFQLVQTLFTYAVAGNANEAPRLLWDALSMDEGNFKDVVHEVKSRMLNAAGILQYTAKNVLSRWTARPGAATAPSTTSSSTISGGGTGSSGASTAGSWSGNSSGSGSAAGSSSSPTASSSRDSGDGKATAWVPAASAAAGVAREGAAGAVQGGAGGAAAAAAARAATAAAPAGPPVPLECCPKFLEAMALVFEAQAYQVNVALTARSTHKKEVLARFCLGISNRYQQALEALASPDPHGVPLVDRIRPAFRVYLNIMRVVVNSVALMFLAEAAMKPSTPSQSSGHGGGGSSNNGTNIGNGGGAANAGGKAGAPAAPDFPKAHALFLRAQMCVTTAQDLVFEARTWKPAYFANAGHGPDASAFGSLHRCHCSAGAAAQTPGVASHGSAGGGGGNGASSGHTRARARPPTAKRARRSRGQKLRPAGARVVAASGSLSSSSSSSSSSSQAVQRACLPCCAGGECAPPASVAPPHSSTTATFAHMLEKLAFGLNELYCQLERYCDRFRKVVTKQQLEQHAKIVLPSSAMFNTEPYQLQLSIQPYSFLAWSAQQKAAKLHFYQAQHASHLPAMQQHQEQDSSSKFKRLRRDKGFQFRLPAKVHEGQVLNLETPHGLLTQFVVPPGAKPGQRVHVQAPIVSFSVRVPSDMEPRTSLHVPSPAGGELLQLQVPKQVQRGHLFSYHV